MLWLCYAMYGHKGRYLLCNQGCQAMSLPEHDVCSIGTHSNYMVPLQPVFLKQLVKASQVAFCCAIIIGFKCKKFCTRSFVNIAAELYVNIYMLIHHQRKPRRCLGNPAELFFSKCASYPADEFSTPVVVYITYGWVTLIPFLVCSCTKPAKSENGWSFFAM